MSLYDDEDVLSSAGKLTAGGNLGDWSKGLQTLKPSLKPSLTPNLNRVKAANYGSSSASSPFLPGPSPSMGGSTPQSSSSALPPVINLQKSSSKKTASPATFGGYSDNKVSLGSEIRPLLVV